MNSYIQLKKSCLGFVSRVAQSAGLPGDRGSIPGRGESIFPLNICVQTGSGAHPAACTMGTGGPLSGAKPRPGRDADHSPCLVPSSKISRIYTSCPLKRLRGV
jgi:hypothetical protein